jgi:putative transcriptional regulator
VAAPGLLDPSFRRTVVLVLEHGPEGALGVVLNRRTGLAVRDALPPELADALAADDRVFSGGPVQPEAVILVADFLAPAEDADLAFGSVGVVDPEVEAGRLDGAVRAVRAFGGYAGWGAGQLESEIAAEAWIDADPEAVDVFTDEPELLWQRVLERKGGSYRLVARMPEDPSVN